MLQGAAKLIACTCLKNGVDEGYPCPDMRANDQGVITCRLPDQKIPVGDTADCTVSILDQRDWGGCVDVQMASALAALPPSAPPAPLVSNAGPYRIDKSTLVDTSAADFTCCALEAEMTVPDYTEGAASFIVTLSGKANGCAAQPPAPTTLVFATSTPRGTQGALWRLHPLCRLMMCLRVEVHHDMYVSSLLDICTLHIKTRRRGANEAPTAE